MQNHSPSKSIQRVCASWLTTTESNYWSADWNVCWEWCYRSKERVCRTKWLWRCYWTSSTSALIISNTIRRTQWHRNNSMHFTKVRIFTQRRETRWYIDENGDPQSRGTFHSHQEANNAVHKSPSQLVPPQRRRKLYNNPSSHSLLWFTHRHFASQQLAALWRAGEI